MRINMDRLSKLAGLPVSNSSSRMLRESKEAEELETDEPMDEMADIEWKNESDKDEYENEVIEVDEAMLVQELRRMKGIIQESKRRKALAESNRRQKKEALYEAQLKRVIDEEVRNVMQEMNLTGGWMYGNKKPARSRNGYSHQGSYLKGFGFK